MYVEGGSKYIISIHSASGSLYDYILAKHGVHSGLYPQKRYEWKLSMDCEHWSMTPSLLRQESQVPTVQECLSSPLNNKQTLVKSYLLGIPPDRDSKQISLWNSYIHLMIISSSKVFSWDGCCHYISWRFVSVLDEVHSCVYKRKLCSSFVCLS